VLVLIKQKKYNDHVKPVFKLTNKEDGYISSVISCLVEIAKLAQPSYLESQNNFKEDTLIKTKVRSTINHHLSKNLHISSIVQLENADCIVISTKLRITSDFDEEFKDEVFEVNNGVLIKRPDNFSFIEIEHYLNKIGAFIVNSNFNIHNDGEREVITTVRYFPKNSLTKEYVDVMGGGIYYPKKIQ